MKKILSIIILITLSGYAYGATALYRKSSNQVVLIDLEDGSFPDHINPYLAVKTGATFPDGTQFHLDGALGVLGYAKIVDGDIVRNATQEEIDTFLPLHENDLLQAEADRAEQYLKNDKKIRRIMRAFASIIVDEFNQHKTWEDNMKLAVSGATSLANFQTRAALIPDIPERDLQDIMDAIANRISKDD